MRLLMLEWVLLVGCGDAVAGTYSANAAETYSVRRSDMSEASSTRQQRIQITVAEVGDHRYVVRFAACALDASVGGGGITIIGPASAAGGCTIDVPGLGPSDALLGGTLQRTDQGLSGSLQGSITHRASNASGTYSAAVSP